MAPRRQPDPVDELDQVMRQVIELFTAPVLDVGCPGTIVVAFRTGQDIDALLPDLLRLSEEARE
jgi:hypothetical protein